MSGTTEYKPGDKVWYHYAHGWYKGVVIAVAAGDGVLVQRGRHGPFKQRIDRLHHWVTPR